jgi:hypothetical protein
MNNVEPKVEKSESEKTQDFVKEYQALCEKHGYQLVVTPVWKVSQDTGTWSTVLQPSIGKLPKE